VGYTPGYSFIVAIVRKARYSGERDAHHIEFWAGYVVLIIDAGRIQSPMRISGK
jgi:hypothetical protein